jgi:hypothetical protein
MMKDGALNLIEDKYIVAFKESEDNNRMVIVDGNHRKELFLSAGIKEWRVLVIDNTRIDPSVSIEELDLIAETLNEAHDAGAVHASFIERLYKIREKMALPQFRTGSGVDWNLMVKSFVRIIFTLT